MKAINKATSKEAEYREKIVNRLFYRMRELFGSYWVMLIGDAPITETKAKWQEALKDFTADDIGNALKSVKQVYPERPPDMFKFVALVKNVKHCKLGHGSNRLFDYGVMEKTTKKAGNNFLKSIRGGL